MPTLTDAHTLVQCENANAEILLPARADLATYTRKLEARGTFGTLTELAKVRAIARDHAGDDAPLVAIPVSDPVKLIPGADSDTGDLIALVKTMGCRPVLVPPCADVLLEPDARDAALVAMTGLLDGVLGPGGDDVDPQIYGEARTKEVQRTNYARDRFEADFALAARRQPLFMFGICRSHQLWNAAFGGSLVQDVRVEGRSAITQDQEQLGIPADQPFIVRWPDGRVRFENRVHIVPKSRLSDALKVESIVTNSYHHQAVDVPGRGMRVVGVVRDDETRSETIEATEDWNIMTTQFHPEMMQNAPEEKQLLTMLGRRAHIFWVLRSLRKQGAVTLSALLDRLAKLPASALADDDWAWAKNELGPRLG
jgi:putative glutamine amidotransferase